MDIDIRKGNILTIDAYSYIIADIDFINCMVILANYSLKKILKIDLELLIEIKEDLNGFSL